MKNRFNYRFDLVCPRCGKDSDYVSDNKLYPVVNCGDCLMDAVEIVEMKTVKVTVEDKA
jgi:hypothetical protein